MESKVKIYASYTHYMEARDKPRMDYKPSITGDKSGNAGLRELEKMKGKAYIQNCFNKKITGYEVTGEEVIIHTTRKPVTLPLKNLLSRLNAEFLPAYSTSRYDR
jgi:hypothetical protein